MPITLITGPANAGKARVVLDRLRRHVASGPGLDRARADAGRPLLVVPTGADADRYRRELATGGPVCGATVCLFSGLLERIAARASADDETLARPPLGALARECLLRTLAAQAWPELAGGGGLIRALSGAIAELQAAGAGVGRLGGALRKGEAFRGEGVFEGEGEGEGAFGGEAALWSVYRRYLDALKHIGVLDVEQRARRALDALRRRPSAWRAAPVLLYGFDDLSALQLDAIETLGLVVDAEVTVSLAWEAGRQAFAGRARTAEELRPLASEHIALPPRAEHYAPQARAVLHRLERFLFEDGEHASLDAGDSVRLLEGGSPRAEMELVASEVRRLLDGGLAPAEIAIVHRSPAEIARTLAEALEAQGVPHSIDSKVSFADTALGRALLGLLRCACLPERASLQDLLCWLRAPGVLERVELADRLEERALRAGVRGAVAARALWESERWQLDRIDRIAEAAARGPLALLDEAERSLRQLLLAPRRGAAEVLGDDDAKEGLGFRAGIRALAELRQLAGAGEELIGGAEGVVGGAEGVIEALKSLRLTHQRPHAEDSIAVLGPLSLRARRVRALLLCGLQEGVFPSPSRPEQILTEPLRRRLGETASARLSRREDALAVERYLLYATVSRPEEQLVISWHAASEGGSATPPSLFLDDICDLFDASLRERRRRRALGADDALAPLNAASDGTTVPVTGPLADQDVLAQLQGREMWSASSLEQWAACPVRWFIERLLRAEGLGPDPEPLARGGLAHAALNELLVALRERTGSARITPQRLPLARALLRQALVQLEPSHPLTVEQERAPAAMRRLEADLQRYLEHAAEQQSPLEPTHLELSFGFPEEPGGLPALELGDGVKLRGRIDRIDLGEGGEAVLYDYKSGSGGSGYSASKWAKDGRFQMALYMRAVERMPGVDVLGGLYQPLSGSDLRARGALVREGAAARLEPVKTDSCEREKLQQMVEEACEAALTAAKQARAGALEPRPATCTWRGGCMYPTICRCL